MPRKGGGEGKYRSLKTGKYVSAYYAKRHPETTAKVEVERFCVEDNLWCCELTCENIAAFEIWNQGESIDPFDSTHACQEHVGEMLYEDSRVFLLSQSNIATPTK